MILRKDVIGHRITKIIGDSTSSDNAFNFTDFVYILDNDVALRMPFDDDSGDILPLAAVSPNHQPLQWPKNERRHHKKILWDVTITDILTPRNCEDRFPDSGAIELSSGWFILQLGGAPHGVLPGIDILNELKNADSMVSVWEI